MCEPSNAKFKHLHADTGAMIEKTKAREATHAATGSQKAQELWRQAIDGVRAIIHSPFHFRTPFIIANREHMSAYDCFDGQSARMGFQAELDSSQVSANEEDELDDKNRDLLVITPAVDGRLKDVGRGQAV